tara:strand:- start:243 stop:362 length:120 start_codon:yes stop_codon:yes gene_type:complete
MLPTEGSTWLLWKLRSNDWFIPLLPPRSPYVACIEASVE